MKLISLKLRNFKGIKEFDLEPCGESQAIYGDNGTGKTTLFDAFSWLLFDKDSANRKDFEIKTIGLDGEPIHGLEHEVEGVLGINRVQIILKKVYSETWSKKRGSANREFTGHTTSYFLNGVPTKKNDYEAWIASIVDEDAFKLLTNPRHFNEVLHWQDRRKILLEVCGDLSDADVIASDSKLAKLPEILSGRKLEDHRKIIAARRTAINNDIEMIPVRISEVNRGLPDAMPATFSKKELEDLRAERNTKAQELANLEAGGGVAEKTKELRFIEAEMSKTEREHWTTTADEAQAENVELRKLEEERAKIDSAMAIRRKQIEDKQASITQYSVKLDALRQDWSAVNSKNFTFEQSDTCPACGQSLPARQLKAASEKATADFNLKKANNLASITEEGHSIKARIEELTDETHKLDLGNMDDAQRLLALLEEVKSGQARIPVLEKKQTDLPADPAYVKLMQKKATIEVGIETLASSHTGAVEALGLILSAIDTKIVDCEEAMAQIKQCETGLQRIEELKTAERTLAEEFEKLEGELFLTDEFVRTKVTMLEERVNGAFEFTRWKMFETQVNGGISEVCEAMVEGVPYSSGLNNGMRIAAGMDIIKTLQKYHGFQCPVWIDQAESFCHLPSMDCQVVSLIVSLADPVLRIEVGGKACQK